MKSIGPQAAPCIGGGQNPQFGVPAVAGSVRKHVNYPAQNERRAAQHFQPLTILEKPGFLPMRELNDLS